MQWDSLGYRNWSSFAWSDTAWTPRAGAKFATGGLFDIVLERGTAKQVMGLGVVDPRTWLHTLVMFDASRDSIGAPDSVFLTSSQSTEFAAAASARRRWAVRAHNGPPLTAGNHVFTLWSDTLGIWHQAPRLGVDEDHVTIAPLDDTSAVVVYAGRSGLTYAVLSGAQWVASGNLDPRPFNASHPRFRIRPSGGLWLFWESFDWMHVSTFIDGVWDRGDSMQFLPPGTNFQPAWFGLDHGTAERPVVVWNNLGYAYTHRTAAVIAFPNPTGWDPPPRRSPAASSSSGSSPRWRAT